MVDMKPLYVCVCLCVCVSGEAMRYTLCPKISQRSSNRSGNYSAKSDDRTYECQLASQSCREKEALVVAALNLKRQFGTGKQVPTSQADHNASVHFSGFVYKHKIEPESDKMVVIKGLVTRPG